MERRQQLSTLLALAVLAGTFGHSVIERRGWETIARAKPVGDLSFLYRQDDDSPPTSALASTAPRPEAVKSALPAGVIELAPHADSELLAWRPLVDTQALAGIVKTVVLAAQESNLAQVEAALPELTAAETSPEPALDVAVVLPLLRADRSETLELADLDLADELWPVPALAQEPTAPAVASQYVRPSPMELARLERIDETVVDSEPVKPEAGLAAADTNPAVNVGVAQPGLVWPEPHKLMGDLERLTKLSDCAAWAHRTAGLVRQLAADTMVAANDSRGLLADLRVEFERGRGMAQGLERKTAIPMRLVLHGLERRLDLWEAAQAVVDAHAETEISANDVVRLSASLTRVEAVLAPSHEGEGWRQYLMLASLARSCQGLLPPTSQSHRDLVVLVLERIDSPALSASQREFLSHEPVLSLTNALREQASDPVHLGEVLAAVEAYEQTADPENARRLADSSRRLSAAVNPSVRQLSEHLESHYRNHNLRVAVSAELLNRMIPQPAPMNGSVRDTILGIPVRGRQTTVSKVGLKLVPDNSAIAIDLQVKGQVEAATVAKSGPATLYTDNDSYYTAVKPIRIDGRGVTPQEAKVDVDSVTQLRGLKTDLDGIPLVGAILRSYVQSKHASSKDAALDETDWKVGLKVSEHLDTLVSTQVALAAAKYQERVVRQVSTLNLEPLAFDMQTTVDRISLRGRLAGEEQLGSHTPRPQALSDSLASVQLHESAINNLLDKVGLAGNEFTPPELQDLFVKKFQLPTDALPRVIGRDVKFLFAASEPVRIRCHDGKLEITLKLDRVENGRQEAESVTVRAVYRPKVELHSVEMVRDGNIDIEGEGLRGRSSLALRAVFTKIFPKERPWILVPMKVFEDPRLADMGVTQFVIRDGWLGASIGPRRKEQGALETAGRDQVGRELR